MRACETLFRMKNTEYSVFFGDTVATSSPADARCASAAGYCPLTSANGGRGDKVIYAETPGEFVWSRSYGFAWPFHIMIQFCARRLTACPAGIAAPTI